MFIFSTIEQSINFSILHYIHISSIVEIVPYTNKGFNLASYKFN